MKIYVIEEEPEFFLNQSKAECIAVVFLEFIDGRNTRAVWVLPDGRTAATDDPLDVMDDGIPWEHGGWPALGEGSHDEVALRAQPQLAPSVFEVLWANAQARESKLIRRWRDRR